MGNIVTDLRDTRDTAKRMRYEQVTPFNPATNVQDAIAFFSSILLPTVTPIAQANYTALAGDRIIEVNFAGNVAITLGPTSARNGLPLEIKDISGGLAAGGWTITITPDAADGGGIDGMASLPIATDYESFQLRPSTSVWRVGS